MVLPTKNCCNWRFGKKILLENQVPGGCVPRDANAVSAAWDGLGTALQRLGVTATGNYSEIG